MSMEAMPRLRPGSWRAIATIALLLTLRLPIAEPIHGQNAASTGPPINRAVPPAGLLGSWILNQELSDHPVLQTDRMANEGQWTSTIVREEARRFLNRSESVHIRVTGPSFLVRNGLAEIRVFPLDGSWRPFGAQKQGRVLVSDKTFSIETVTLNWVGVDTFSLQQDQLVRTTRLRSRLLSGVRAWFTTVYDRPMNGPAPDPSLADGNDAFAWPQTIRIVPPAHDYRELVRGRVVVQTLVVDPAVSVVEFLVDGGVSKRVEKPPFRAEIELAEPPREQPLEVRAYDAQDELLGSDEILLNPIEEPPGVRIARIRDVEPSDAAAVHVEVVVSMPRSETLERVEFYRGDHLVAVAEDFRSTTTSAYSRTILVEGVVKETKPDDFVRVTARFASGLELEDAELVLGADYQADIDVHLVQLQVLVTDREGNPVSGLVPEDFDIREGGRRLEPQDLHTAEDVRLILGLAIDSSESMRPVWRHLQYAARSFFAASVKPGDASFLVEFDDTVRLLQPLTADTQLLTERLPYAVPDGGTALNDGLLFSLLQFRSEPGRRALVVVTDGVDLDSRWRWEQAADFAERLGLPIYFIELDRSAKAVIRGGELADRTPEATLIRERARRRLGRISRQTGGRHFHIDLIARDTPWIDRIDEAFAQIETDLRHQHVLTYYSDQPSGVPVRPVVKMTGRGLKLRSAVPLEAIQ